jgi:hypothetical protein
MARAGRRRDSDAGSLEQTMANDDAWVEDVRRWALGGASDGAALGDAADASDDIALGYEAAHPALQARHWPDAPTTDR